MPLSIKLGLVALAAAMLFTSAASARSFSITNQNIRATWRELIFEGKPERPNNPGPIRCAVTMEGSFHTRTIIKEAGALIGYITRAQVQHPCVGGEYIFHNGTETILRGRPETTLPWHLRYSSFTGRLPDITALNVVMRGMVMSADFTGLLRCLETFGSETEERIWIFNIAAGTITSFQPTVVPKHLIIWHVMDLRCPEYGMLQQASTTLTLLGATTAVRLTLI
jgi:hypothetical protein